MKNPEWYAAKTVCRHRGVEDGIPKTLFEERVVLLHAADFEDAIAKGELEAQEYSRSTEDVVYTGYINVYRLDADVVAHSTEIFSLMRESDLPDRDYLDHFYDDGKERTQIVQ
jgi:hypothetical protein